MIITLIGMSNIGKTYWSKKIEKIGFRRIGCDDLIREALKYKLEDSGYSGPHNLARWLGQPYEKDYTKKSQEYLDIEKQVVKEFVFSIENNFITEENVVFDTTGSVIYIDKEVLSSLKMSTTIVLLDTPSLIEKQMYQNYFGIPKPVIWGDLFEIVSGQTRKETLEECFPRLLKYRNKIYRNYADICLDYFLLRKPDFNAEKFIRLCQDAILKKVS